MCKSCHWYLEIVPTLDQEYSFEAIDYKLSKYFGMTVHSQCNLLQDYYMAPPLDDQISTVRVLDNRLTVLCFHAQDLNMM